jgi:hypothetical protein
MDQLLNHRSQAKYLLRDAMPNAFSAKPSYDDTG